MTNVKIIAINLDSTFPNSINTNLPPYESLTKLLNLLDQESIEQINKFRRLQDAQRCTLGRLLPRYLLTSKFNLNWNSLKFSKTPTGRPYAIHSNLPSKFDFNLSHDSNWVVLGYTTSESGSGSRIGIDVMQVKIPWDDENIDQFIIGLGDNLTTNEKNHLASLKDEEAKLIHIIALWTLKEAYSKALGIGLLAEFNQLDFKFSANSNPPNQQYKKIIIEPECWIFGKKLENWRFELKWIDNLHLVAVAIENVVGLEKGVSPEIQIITLEDILRVATKIDT